MQAHKNPDRAGEMCRPQEAMRALRLRSSPALSGNIVLIELFSCGSTLAIILCQSKTVKLVQAKIKIFFASLISSLEALFLIFV
jgi:hypothetical protein